MSKHTAGREGRAQHHFEMYIHRETELIRKKEFKAKIITTIVISAWGLLTLICFWLR